MLFRSFYARSAEAVGSQVEASRAELAAAFAQDSEARANLTNAQHVFDRQQALVAAGGVTEQEVDASRTALTVARARLDAGFIDWAGGHLRDDGLYGT